LSPKVETLDGVPRSWDTASLVVTPGSISEIFFSSGRLPR
jgi:hypothetical protein